MQMVIFVPESSAKCLSKDKVRKDQEIIQVGDITGEGVNDVRQYNWKGYNTF